MTPIIDRYIKIREALPEHVSLLPVSKLHPPETIAQLLPVVKTFGENYVQEILQKAPILPDAKWNLIGPLQTNKVNQLLKVQNVYRISSVNNKHLIDKLQQACERYGRTIEVLIQVNTTGEQSKYGCHPSEALEIARYINSDLVQLKGFMAIGHLNDIALTKSGFEKLREIRDALDPTLELSMGMSNDMQIAIDAGSTEVRIGTAIFGLRPSKN